MMNFSTSDIPPEDDLTHMSFKDPMWLQTYPLSVHTALDYFSLSQFYDKKCNNENLKMQRLDMSLLRNLPGIEYELIHVREPALFVVRKSYRENPDKTIPRATYYILNGTIYQAPTLFSVLNSRLSSSIFFVRESLKEVSSMIKFQPSDGHSWTAKADGPNAIPHNAMNTFAQNKKQIFQYDPLVTSILQKFPPPPSSSSVVPPTPTPPAVNSPPTIQPNNNNNNNINNNNINNNNTNNNINNNMPPPPVPAPNGLTHPTTPQQPYTSPPQAQPQQADLKRKLNTIQTPPLPPATKRRV